MRPVSERIELPPAPGSVAAARRWSTDRVGPVHGEELAARVALLVSELVTNVVLHARTRCEVVLSTDGDRVRVEVHDGSDALPAQAGWRSPEALSGRGMVLVDELADTHGVEVDPGGGKLVWFEVLAPAGPVSR